MSEVYKDSSDRIKIEIPEIYKKVDESFWEELENYLFSGFLTSRANILNQEFIFKTLNHHEIRYIRGSLPLNSSDENQKLASTSSFIAHSIFSISGENFLYDRPKHLRRLIRLISKIPIPIQDAIIQRLAALNSKASRLYPLVEVYSYESRSRFKWLHIKDSPIHSSLNTGIPGTENLGMNYCQQTWVSMNSMIDRRDIDEKDWANAKFIGSCFAGKGVRSIDEKDKARVERERVEREDLKMKVLQEYLNRNNKPQAPVLDLYRLPDGRMAEVESRIKASSVEELAKELESALNNEKDYHDLAIEKHLESARKRSEELEKTKNDWLKSPIMEELQEMVESGGGSRVLGGKNRAEEYLARMQKMRNEQIEKTRIRLQAGQEPSDNSSSNEG